MAIADWNDWPRAYDDPSSELVGRMHAVPAQVATVVSECPPGPVTVVGVCGGQGREVIGALADHPSRLFTERDLEEVGFEALPGSEYSFTVARSRRGDGSAPYPEEATVFTFGSSRGTPAGGFA